MACVPPRPFAIKRKASPFVKDEAEPSSKRVRQGITQDSESPLSLSNSIRTWLQDLPVLRSPMSPITRTKTGTILKKRAFEGKEEEAHQIGNKKKTGEAKLIKPLTPPRSDPSLPSASTPETGSALPSTSGRCGKPTYREEELNFHGVEVDAMGLALPEYILKYARGLTRKPRDSPGPSSDEWLDCRDLIQIYQSRSEAIFQHQILSETPLFPKERRYMAANRSILIAVDSQVQFKSTSVPRKPNKPPLVSPKPDYFYGYTPAAFAVTPLPLQKNFMSVMQRYELKDYALPSHSPCLWPFLIMEFKSLSGSTLEAQNQIAGAGASCVNSVQTLLNLAYPDGYMCATDSLIFSCVVNPERAGVWVHWRSPNSELAKRDSAPFVSSQIEVYSFYDPEHMKALRVCLLNLMDWALGERLHIIKNALTAFEKVDATALILGGATEEVDVDTGSEVSEVVVGNGEKHKQTNEAEVDAEVEVNLEDVVKTVPIVHTKEACNDATTCGEAVGVDGNEGSSKDVGDKVPLVHIEEAGDGAAELS